MASLRKFTKRFIILLNTGTCFLFLLACSNAFLHPDKWWFVSLLGLIFPLLLLFVLGFLIFWLFACYRYFFISLITLIIGWQNIHAFFGFNLLTKTIVEKPAGSLRLLTWNVRRWDDFTTRKIGAAGHRRPMMDFVEQQQADFLCFQEFYEPDDPHLSNILYISDSLHYPYHFFSNDYRSPAGKYATGVVIFSKYPIVQTHQMKYDTAKGSESLLEADISVNGKMIRLCTTHLQSVLFKSKDFRDVEIIRNADDSILEASMSIAKKLKRAFSLRGYQADSVSRQLDASPYPVIMCGDFNDVPNSYTYFRIRGDRQDAFIQKGFGIGRTYVHLSPTLRIDYIFPDRKFTILQAEKLTTPYSDHRPVIADIQLLDAKR